MQTKQENVPYGVAFGVTKANWSSGLFTSIGDSGMVRYVILEKVAAIKSPDWAFKFAGRGKLKIRFRSLLIERFVTH